MIAITVIYTVLAGREADAEEHLRALQSGSRTEPGCVFYVVHRNVDDGRRFFIYEMYKDQAALDAHRATDHFKRHGIEGIRTIAERREAETYVPIV